jgi:hypothetical protein
MGRRLPLYFMMMLFRAMRFRLVFGGVGGCLIDKKRAGRHGNQE